MIRAIVLDVETGGLYPSQHALLALAAVAVEINDQCLITFDEFHVLIEPNDNLGITAGALRVQGLKWAGVEQGYRTPEGEALSRFWAWLDQVTGTRLDWPIIAHNAGFDRDFLGAAIRRNNAPMLQQLVGRHANWICTQDLARWLVASSCMNLPKRGWSLDSLAEHLGVGGRIAASSHDALEDAKITARVAEKLVRFAGWESGPRPKMEDEATARIGQGGE